MIAAIYGCKSIDQADRLDEVGRSGPSCERARSGDIHPYPPPHPRRHGARQSFSRAKQFTSELAFGSRPGGEVSLEAGE